MLSPSLLKYFPKIAPDSTIMKVTPSGSYVAGGDTLNISPSALADPNGVGVVGYPDADVLPSVCPEVIGYVGFTGASENQSAVVIPGATQGTYKLQQFASPAAGGAELSAGAYASTMLTGYWLVKVYW